MENKRLGKGLEQLFSNERLDFDSMEKEIVFVTDNGTLTPEQKAIIKDALGIENPTVTNSDLKSQEFDQVVILNKLVDNVKNERKVRDAAMKFETNRTGTSNNTGK